MLGRSTRHNASAARLVGKAGRTKKATATLQRAASSRLSSRTRRVADPSHTADANAGSAAARSAAVAGTARRAPRTASRRVGASHREQAGRKGAAAARSTAARTTASGGSMRRATASTSAVRRADASRRTSGEMRRPRRAARAPRSPPQPQHAASPPAPPQRLSKAAHALDLGDGSPVGSALAAAVAPPVLPPATSATGARSGARRQGLGGARRRSTSSRDGDKQSSPAAASLPASAASRAATPPPHVWTRDDFELGKAIGRGKYGNVYLARVKASGVRVAMKVLFKQQMVDGETVTLLRREVELQSRLVHPNIVKLHAYFHDKTMAYLVLQYCSGGEVFKALQKEHHFSDAKAAEHVTAVAQAVQYLHDRNVAHRDIKPENLLYDDAGVPLLADFGWAVHGPPGHDRRSTFCGTLEYLAPELLEDGSPHDKAVDVWSIGVLAYEFLFGVSPFASSNDADTCHRIQHVDLRYPSTIDVGANARDFIEWVLNPDPVERPTVEQVLQHPWLQPYLNSARNRQAAAARAARRGSTGSFGVGLHRRTSSGSMVSATSAVAAASAPGATSGSVHAAGASVGTPGGASDAVAPVSTPPRQSRSSALAAAVAACGSPYSTPPRSASSAMTRPGSAKRVATTPSAGVVGAGGGAGGGGGVAIAAASPRRTPSRLFLRSPGAALRVRVPGTDGGAGGGGGRGGGGGAMGGTGRALPPTTPRRKVRPPVRTPVGSARRQRLRFAR